MPSITLEIDSEKELILLKGEYEALINHRLAFSFMRNRFDYEVISESICIHCSRDTIQTDLDAVRRMLKKYGFTKEYGREARLFLQERLQEEENFKEFSRKAMLIRNNECDKDDFKRFTDVVAQNLSARSLYELQLLSAYHLAFAQNSCNFSVPGAGKTSIVYGAYSYLSNLPSGDSKHIDAILVIGPLNSFGPWEKEYQECFGRSPNSKRLTSALSKEEKENYLFSSTVPADLTLLSYNSVPRLQDGLEYFLRNNKVMVVLDEAHRIKNTTGGIISQAVLNLAKYASSRVVLTGTPAPNGYDDLNNMFEFIWPFENVIGLSISQLRDLTRNRDTARLDKLIKNISPFFIRIKKSDLGLPPAIECTPQLVAMGPKQREIYDAIEEQVVPTFVSRGRLNGAEGFITQLRQARVIRLMQAATDPSLLKKPLSHFMGTEDSFSEAVYQFDNDLIHTIASYDGTEIPSKYLAAGSLVKELVEADKKVVVWACFVDTIMHFQSYLETLGIVSEVLYGGTPIESEKGIGEEKTRERIVDEFHRGKSGFSVIIANPYAVSESISLHKASHDAIYLERSFNAAHYVQSKDRIHRYGLKPNTKTSYYYFLSEDSIDETIHERLIEKEFRMNEIAEKSPIPLFDNLTENVGDEDIRRLIKDYVRRTKSAL